ncbi:MAG: type I restriction endonuclease subunit R [Candidatus Moraniibacteriota bacterium]
MTHKYTESTLEDAVLGRLESLGFTVVFGPDIAFDGECPERTTEANYSDIVLVGRLREAVDRINPNIPAEAREEAVKKVLAVPFSSPDTLVANRSFQKMLAEGVDVEYRREDGSIAGDKVLLFDFSPTPSGSPSGWGRGLNDFLAVNQFTIIEGKRNRRPDVIVFVNGLPLAVFEIKNPASENATVKGAYNQIQTYKKDIPSLFAYNSFCVISDGTDARVGTITSDFGRFMKWRSADGALLAPRSVLELDTLIDGMFPKERLLDIVRNFVVFEDGGSGTVKKLAAYHQYFAVNKAIKRTVTATREGGSHQGGVVWHTQGSGKSLTMVFYAGKIIQALNNPTLVILTDRNDLDDQLFGVFSSCKDLLRQTPAQAGNREQLQGLLSVASGGVVFTTIQKFLPEGGAREYPLLSDRSNIIVIADEAHRSQYDFIDGFARHMREALPNASFLGFTGTPIELSDKNTRAVFGDYVDVYDVARAVEDGATVPIYYEARLAKIGLLESERPKIDAEFEDLTEGEELERKEKLKSRWARLEAMVGSEKRIRLIAADVVKHFEDRRATIEGKGMFVSMSRRIAVELYDEIVKRRPEWGSDDIDKGFLKVVMTGSASDPERYQKHIHTKEERELLARRMKDPDDSLKLVIVRDMWLTGFDAPSLHTMYIDKPMHGHGLMQAIARVNRVWKDKPGGLVVDYLGIAPSLKEALAEYTQSGADAPMISQDDAVSAMLEKYEVTKAMFHGFEYGEFFTDDAGRRSRLLAESTDFILTQDKGKMRYLQIVAELSRAFALAVPHDSALRIRDEVGFFQAVRAVIVKLEKSGGEGGPTEEDYDLAIRQIVSNAIASEEVIDVFSAAGLTRPNVAILSDEFLKEIQGLERKNVALELLRRLLDGEIRTMERKFLVKARSFSKMLEETIRKYQNQTIEAAAVIVELVELAKKIREEKERGVSAGLSEDELAFYDALCDNESAVLELGDETLRTIAQELVVMLRKNTSIDWTLKENVRARLRVYVKKLLNKYHYPPDKQEVATQLVLEQAETLCGGWAE